MSDKARETIADVIAENLGDVYCCTRVWESWQVGTMSQSDFHPAAEDEDVTFDMADAILNALPDIITDMVPDLEWEEYPENGVPVMAKSTTKFGTYFICDDTDDFSGLYCEFVTHQDATWFGAVRAKTELIFQFEHEDDHTKLYHIPNAHNRATILKALGMKEKGND